MGRRIRILPGVDRAEFDGEPVGLQLDGGHHFDRRLFAVHLFHGTESGVEAIANTQRSLTPGDRSGPDAFLWTCQNFPAIGSVLLASCLVTLLRSLALRY